MVTAKKYKLPLWLVEIKDEEVSDHVSRYLYLSETMADEVEAHPERALNHAFLVISVPPPPGVSLKNIRESLCGPDLEPFPRKRTESFAKEDSILEEAGKIISKDRREAYGPVRGSFENIARVWTLALKREITPEEVALCMIGLKFVRECHKHGRDNLVDLCGYSALAEKLRETE